MSYFTYQAISGRAYNPANLSVSARTVSAGTNVVMVNLTSCGLFQGKQVVGVLYNTPVLASTQLSAFSATPTTTMSAYGTTFGLSRAFHNQEIALVLKDNGTVQFTATSSLSTVALTQLSSASQIQYNDSWPELQRKVKLCML